VTDQKVCTPPTRAATRLPLCAEARAGDAKLEDMAGGAGCFDSKDGMITKILAANAPQVRASTVIAWGREPDALVHVWAKHWHVAGGTNPKQQARKQWMADHLQLRGSVIDDGAVSKLKVMVPASCPLA
jgi:glutamate 5-kinase